ncbi:MAG: hypothetical protein K9N07_10565 [Candidatus Cloacimonetes bacterium]|nr:hypothetical protein [Candidatus Cloacimonadota bacterium]MCF8262290.1 hypothetical protein [Melioribacteraceae bacterium]
MVNVIQLSTKGLFFIYLIQLFIGCASLKTNTEKYREIDKLVESERYSAAIHEIEMKKDDYYDDKDILLYYLDMGVLHHYAGNYKESNKYLERANQSIEALFTQSISKGASSVLLNENVLDYSGEDYENLYINIFRAMNYYKLNDIDAALVEIRAMHEKLDVINDNYADLIDSMNKSDTTSIDYSLPELEFKDSAFGRYFSSILFERLGFEDDARIDLEKAIDLCKEQKVIYNFPIPSFEFTSAKMNSTCIDLIVCLGRAPLKEPKEYYISTTNNYLIIKEVKGNSSVKVEEIFWPKIKPNLNFKFAVPILISQGSSVHKIKIFDKNEFLGELKKFESINNIAEETFERKKKIIYLKAIVRTIVKGLLVEAANRELDKQTGGGLLGSLTRSISSKLMNYTENADLRTSRYYPGEIWVGKVLIPPKKQTLEIKYYNTSNIQMGTDSVNVNTIDRNDLVILNHTW